MKAIKYTTSISNIFIEDRDPDDIYPDRSSWTITNDGSCLNKDLEWDHEPSPSSRDKAFLERCRYTLDEAKELLNRYKDK